MPYLIDSNCFIEAKNNYYAFDVCPGFWDWLEQENQLGIVCSIDKIADELKGHADQLADWAKSRARGFFLPLDQPALSSVGQIAQWASSPNAGFKPHVISAFLGCADPFLIAFALAHGHTVVSHERLIPGIKRVIKIPSVCQHFGIPYMTLFELLRLTGAKFVLP